MTQRPRLVRAPSPYRLQDVRSRNIRFNQIEESRAWRNFVTDFGGNEDGSTDNLQAWIDCRAWTSVQTRCGLIIPPGDYALSSDIPLLATGVNTPPYNIADDIIISGYGATLQNCHLLGGFGFTAVTAFVENANVGDRAVTLRTISDASNFLTDLNGEPLRSVAITGLEMQAPTYPPNTFYFDFTEIVAVNTLTGIITLKDALTQNYKTTFPPFDTAITGIDGPAMIAALDPRWNSTVHWKGVTFTFNNQCYAANKNILFTDCAWPNGAMVPSQNKLFQATGCNLGSQQIEMDKEVERLVITNCTAGSIVFQSASIKDASINGLVVDDFVGTPLAAEITGLVAASLQLGTVSYGPTTSLTISDSVFGTATYTRNPSLISDFSFNSGVFSRALSSGSVPWAVPGAKCFVFTSDLNNVLGAPFTVTDVRKNGTNVDVVTTLSGGVPSFTGIFQPSKMGPLGVGSLSVVNCSGCEDAVEMSLAPAGTPNCAYVNRTYTGNIGQAAVAVKFGRLVYFKVNVVRAYTGAQSTCLFHVAAKFGAPVIDASCTYSQWDAVIDCKVTGLRVVTPGVIIGSRGSDSIPAIDAAWFAGGIGPYLGADLSGDSAPATPIVTIEALFDQSEVP